MPDISKEKISKELIQQSLAKSFSYEAYRVLVSELAEEGKSTGLEQSEALTTYTQLNNKRMKRWDKTLKLEDKSLEAITQLKRKITWLVLTESWCGDAAPALPVMHKLAELNSNLTLKIVLRDENDALMNQLLTNGSRSIPKLVAIDDVTHTVIAEWGPRSAAATKLVEDYKLKHGKLSPEFKQELQSWYNKDKGQSLVKDLLASLTLK